MNHPLQTTWETYTASWKAKTTAEKNALFVQSLDEECVYCDPLALASGWDELSNYMMSFHQQVPGGYFVTQQFSSHHDRSVTHWNMHNGAGEVIGEGVSFGQYNGQGKLMAITGFFDTP